MHKPGSSTILSLPAASLILLTLINPVSSSAKFADGTKTCLINGDADVYGLGIRLNFYLQWAAMIFSTWVDVEQINFSRRVSNILAISVYTNLFFGVSNGSLIAAEWWIVYFETFVLTLGFVPHRLVLKKKSVLDMGFLGVLWCMIVFAECWLWFEGVDLEHKEGCVIKVFLLFFAANVQNKKWKTVFQIGSVLSSVFTTVLLIVGCRREWENWEKVVAGGEEGNGTRNAENEKENVNVIILKAGLSVFQLIIGGLAILQIEMTMKVNSISVSAAPLTSSGQLIGFLNGIYMLGAVFVTCIKVLLKKKNLC
jgi:hypothetical protein